MLTINELLVSALTLLMGVLIYFLKELLRDFRRVEAELVFVKSELKTLKSDFQGMHNLLKQRLYYLEKHLERAE